MPSSSRTELPEFRPAFPNREQGMVHPFDGVEIPFAVTASGAPGPVLLLTAGVHGSEFCSIEAALRMMRRPPPFRGTLVVLPILNVKGFFARSIYVMPEDGRNLNRMFPGRPDGSASERLAHWLVSEVYPKVDATIDLHGGDLDESLVPFSLFPAGHAPSRALAEAFGLGISISAGGEGYTINASGRLGVPSVLAEVSGNGLWDEALVGRLTDGVQRVMHHLGMTDAAPAKVGSAEQVVTMWVPSAPVDGLWYPAIELNDPVEANGVLGEIRDMFGAVLAEIRSQKAGFILYRLTSLSVNAGEALLGVGTPLG